MNETLPATLTRALGAAFSALAIAIAGTPSASAAQSPELVWVWNPQCPKPMSVALQVRLDGKPIYSTSLPLCKWQRNRANGRASFRFTAARRLVWYGYRSEPDDGSKDPGDPTAAGTALEVDFWQAGGETDAIELGYTVAGAAALYMNSVHIVSLTRRNITTMAPGLVLETRPGKRR